MDTFLSPFNIRSEVILSLSFDFNKDQDVFKKTTSSLQMENTLAELGDEFRSEEDEGKRVFMGKLHIDFKSFADEEKTNEEASLSIEVGIIVDVPIAFLSSYCESEEEEKSLINVTLISLLASYARIQVENLTSLTPYEKISLPAINPQAVHAMGEAPDEEL